MSIETAIRERCQLQEQFELLGPLRMTRLGEEELMMHGVDIDIVCAQFVAEKRMLTNAEIEQCRRRLMRFAHDQFHNRTLKN